MAAGDVVHWELAIGAFTIGVALIAGLALRPTLANLLARLQVALTDPFRIGDQLMTETECGTVEKITSTYVVLKLVDKRRLFVPLSCLLRHPFQNLTRQNIQFVAEITVSAERPIRVDRARTEFLRILGQSDRWDCRVAEMHVAGARAPNVDLRCTFSAANAHDLTHLRFEVRERLLAHFRGDKPMPSRQQFDFTSVSSALPGLEPGTRRGRAR